MLVMKDLMRWLFYNTNMFSKEAFYMHMVNRQFVYDDHIKPWYLQVNPPFLAIKRVISREIKNIVVLL